MWLISWLFPVMWLAYIVYWRMMADDVKGDERREQGGSRLLRLLLMIVVLVLLGVQRIQLGVLDRRFLADSMRWYWIGAVVTACGLLFSICGRHALGRNWSRAVTIKQDHELITRGPYKLVRHPIYTGLLTALLGSALALGEWRGLVAVALAFVILLRKLRLEEQWMRTQFGEPYEQYSARVRALVPYIF